MLQAVEKELQQHATQRNAHDLTAEGMLEEHSPLCVPMSGTQRGHNGEFAALVITQLLALIPDRFRLGGMHDES